MKNILKWGCRFCHAIVLVCGVVFILVMAAVIPTDTSGGHKTYERYKATVEPQIRAEIRAELEAEMRAESEKTQIITTTDRGD